ncbi:hypothetical protein ACFVZT_12220 [Streptomyces sp. NPDC058321]|uniref:SCO4402 family protein n=1 Tax=Streptomyces sp. NPDC058321 TaxID=3346445 RepID=UPI0036DFBC81
METPWLRSQLIDWLTMLSDRDWQERNWVLAAEEERGGGVTLDAALDFFDDSGVLEEPDGRIGFVLVDEKESAAMAELNSALDAAISGPASSDSEIIETPAWSGVVDAARHALIVLTDNLG